MSLILKGIDLPKDSDVYILAICEKGDVYIKDGLNQYVPLRGARAIQIPKGHGRLIDGDKLEEQCTPPSYCVWMNEINDAPTILEAEE